MALLVTAAVSPTLAASVTLSRSTRPVSLVEVAAGVPAGSFINDFYVTSASDLLLIGQVEISATLYQHNLGSDVSAPYGEALSADPALAADSFLAMPGQAMSIGGGFDGPAGDHAWFDLTNDGPQQNFHFARITTLGQSGVFFGRMDLRGYDNVVSLPFQFTLPGVESDLSLAAYTLPITLEYSLDSPTVAPPLFPPRFVDQPIHEPINPPVTTPIVDIPAPPSLPDNPLAELPSAPAPQLWPPAAGATESSVLDLTAGEPERQDPLDPLDAPAPPPLLTIDQRLWHERISWIDQVAILDLDVGLLRFSAADDAVTISSAANSDTFIFFSTGISTQHAPDGANFATSSALPPETLIPEPPGITLALAAALLALAAARKTVGSDPLPRRS